MWTCILTIAIAINELMASNAGSVMSPAINFDSWIELYNPTEQPINLGGMYLSNDANNLTLWQMPNDMGTIPAGGFKVVWLGSNDIKLGQEGNEVGKKQAPFKLDCDGGNIYLSDKDGQLITSQKYPEALSRTAWARKTDGGDEWGWTADATPGESNATATFATQRVDPPVVDKNSTIFTGTLKVNVEIPEGTRLMYTTDGSLPKAPKPEGEEEVDPWSHWVKNGDCEGDDATCLPSKNGNNNNIVNVITDGAGVEDSRGIKVHSVANAQNDDKTQFFVYTPDHVWQTGEQFRFSMKVRADKAAKIKAFAQKKPGEAIEKTTWGGWGGWGGGGSTTTPISMLNETYDVTTEWTEISYEGVITSDQADEQWSWGGGGWGGGGWGNQTVTYSLQTISFNLNVLKSENNYYFDEISWDSLPLDTEEEPTKESIDGKFDVSTTTNYTFRLYKDGELPSVPVIRSYIQTNNKYTLPVISIVGDKKYFTDPKIGLDCDGDGTNGVTGNGQDRPKNYNQPWDRPVNFSYMTPEGETLFSQDANIKVSGGWTRSQSHRSFKLKSSKIFDGQNRYDFSFFPQKPYTRNKTILLRNGGNDFWTHNARFMDPALETIIQRSGIDIDVQSCQPVIEYINGELRGVFNMREPNNDDFAYANWGYDDEEIDALENMEMKNGTDSVLNIIFDLAKNINEPGKYDELKTMLDIDEFTNYMAVTMFLDNDDWPNNNIKAYRSQKDGRYRFVSFDLDYAFALRNFNKDNDNPFTYFLRFKDADKVYDEDNRNKEIVNLFLDLMGHDEYRRKFIDTFCLMGGSVFEPSRASDIVDELLDQVQSMCQLMRTQNINDGTEPNRAANTIKNKLNGRSKKMAGHLKNFSYAQLSNSAQAVTLTADTEGAHIYINGLDVPYADFDGHLFAPVELKATAPAGYKFAGWKKGSEDFSAEETIAMPEDATVSLTATFTPLTEEEMAEKNMAPVRINEVSANDGIYVNDYFKRKDWVELYNTTNEDIDVEGMYLTDNLDKLTKFQITKGESQANTIIPAHGYLIIWCDKENPLSQLHASFKLAAEGDELLLWAADGSWQDRFTYPAHNSDQTVGRYPDGNDKVYVMNVPTIEKANITSSYVIEVEQDSTVVGISDLAADTTAGLTIRYTSDRLVVRTTVPVATATMDICNMAGQTLSKQTIDLSSGYAELTLESLASGYYIARISDGHGHSTTCKFIKK